MTPKVLVLRNLDKLVKFEGAMPGMEALIVWKILMMSEKLVSEVLSLTPTLKRSARLLLV